MASNFPSRIFSCTRTYKQLNVSCISPKGSFPSLSRSCQRPSFLNFPTRSHATTPKTPPVIKQAQEFPRDASASFDQQLQKASSVLASSSVPDEQMVYRALKICENLAVKLSVVAKDFGRSSRSSDGPTTNLLSMNDRDPPAKGSNVDLNKRRRIKKISEMAYRIAQDPKVFMTQKLLELYVRIQNLLGQPQSFPHVFDLFASKAIPKPRASPPTFKDSNVNSASVAIPLPIAKSALNAAIEMKDLALCLSIIDMSVSTSAFRRAKFIRKALLPVTALALSPVAAYNIAWQLCKYSDLVEPETLTNYATVGIMTYIGITASLGFVALATANDQMDRVTWIPGTPLSERWFREEERALIDQVAGAWGLKNPEKRGGEEGFEWEELRNWTFRRGMYLDKPELMEGME